MTSAINPNNIDGEYPVAGQDNNSQGFRDNFTSTKTNFQAAADEITDLQNKAVLKAALSGGTVNNALGNVVMSGGIYNGFAYQRADLGTISSSVNINVSTAPIQTLTVSGAGASLNFTGWPSTVGVYASVTVIATMTAGQTLTMPAAVSWTDRQGITGVNPGATALISPIYTAAYDTTVSFVFGSTTQGAAVSLDVASPTNYAANGGTETITTSGAQVSLLRTATSFNVASTSTATLSNGMNGQFKTLVNTNNNDVVVSVVSHAWPTTGTITLPSQGSGCTLQFINGAWYCIGNNGATFG